MPLPMKQPNNGDLLTAFNSAINPLMMKISAIEDRTRDMITRVDLEKMRIEIETRFAQSNALEPRLKSIEKDISEIVESVKDQDRLNLSGKDRFWTRIGQVGGVIALAVTIVNFLMTHNIK